MQAKAKSGETIEVRGERVIVGSPYPGYASIGRDEIRHVGFREVGGDYLLSLHVAGDRYYGLVFDEPDAPAAVVDAIVV